MSNACLLADGTIIAVLTREVIDSDIPENAFKGLDLILRKRNAIVETGTFAQRGSDSEGIAICLCLENVQIHRLPNDRITCCIRTSFVECRAGSCSHEHAYYPHRLTSQSRKIDHLLRLRRDCRAWNLDQNTGSL
jgi:hypothetical protein